MTQRGFSLIEALIALLVLSIGLIGVAAMQIKALQSATEGYQRSIAVVAAVDAQERIWNLLASHSNCEAIKESTVSALKDDWIEHWSADTNAKPLRGTNWDNSDVRMSEGCEFTIVIALNSVSSNREEEYLYSFILPNVEDTP